MSRLRIGSWTGMFLVVLASCSAPQVTRTVNAERTPGIDLSDLSRQPREVAGRCVGGASRALPPGAHDISRARGDFDGDGLTDRFLVYDPTKGPEEPVPDEPDTTADFGPWRIRMELATGAVTDEPFTEWAGGVLGAFDLNGDGRDEMLIHTGGATQSVGEVIALVDCRVTEVMEERKNGSRRPFSFTYYAHSHALGTTGLECLNADDDDAREAVSTYAAPDANGDDKGDYLGDQAGKPGSRSWIWSADVYELRGNEMVFEKRLEGRTGSLRPAHLKFGNDIDCG